ncbi:M16 family metallopeptidase [Polyangium aurulentum]|uniref:M16 family metallopeptidase n=1 Tax=Polyangium aurulentum TaxID=2567896 RepID=UPI00146C6A22|nr:pitrilysin family protein [Polyangium aurulentum]UQA58859.1 insulinase family protein [Polyangium aurulentum]
MGVALAAALSSAALVAGPAPSSAAPDKPSPDKPGADKPQLPKSTPRAQIKVAYDKYTLPNGLVVILHEDHSLPLVAVNTMVKVGSRFEEPKRTGFAHLFEHLMFMGTKRVPTKAFDAWMEAEGGWNNAWTSEDRTDYYDVGPAHVLPLLLWLEADRFSSLAAEMTKDKLDVQRGVVRNERRQRTENEPYGKVELRLPELLYPPGHPYHHPVIGSHEDLQAATVEDVKSFFNRFYVPNNASLVVAGDFNPGEVKPLIEKWFGAMPKASLPAAPVAPAAKLGKIVRETIPDKVELGKVVIAWHSPARYAPGDAELDLLSVVLTEGKASRLYKALVYDQPLAQEVSAVQSSGDLGSSFQIEAIAQPGVPLAKLEAAIDAELKKITGEAVTADELIRAKNQYETGFVSRLQSVVARASMLNQYETFVGDPGWAEKDLERYRAVTADALLRTAKSTLDPNARVIIHCVPQEKQSAPQGAGGAK